MDRLCLDTFLMHVHDKHGQALVLGRFRVRAGQQDPVIGEVGTGGPDLLAIDHPFIAVLDGASLNTRNVRTGGWLGEELAPDFLAAKRLFNVALLVLVRAEGDHGRHTHAETDGERTDRRIKLGFFLVPDDLLHGRTATPAPFLGPGDLGKATFGFRLLPRLGAFQEVIGGSVTATSPVLELQVFFKESAGFLAEFCFFRGIVKVHDFSSLSGVLALKSADKFLFPDFR